MKFLFCNDIFIQITVNTKQLTEQQFLFQFLSLTISKVIIEIFGLEKIMRKDPAEHYENQLVELF